MFVPSIERSQNSLEKALGDLFEKIQGNPKIDIDKVRLAAEFGQEAHLGQFRKNGDPYFTHPVRVALRAIEYDLDSTTIIGSLLHDVIEDTTYTHQDIILNFGETVANLIEALTKVKESKSLTLYKIFELGKVDFRVILIKLLDRLDNMSDLEALARKKQRQICRESLTIYCEVAHGLGLLEIEEEMRALIFKKLYPNRYHNLLKSLSDLYQDRIGAIEQIRAKISASLSPGLSLSVTPIFIKSHQYLTQNGEVDQVLDQIVIETREPIHCYQILGELHTQFRSIPLSIRDFISNPKANGWRGLSTQVIINGEMLSLQIVTQDFQESNRKGLIPLIQGGVYQSESYQQFLQLYLDVAGDNVRIEDVFRHNKSRSIQVLTPKGKVIELRYGASILDFGFMIHTELGLSTVGGVINGIRYPRSKILEEGMMVKILTGDNVRPSAEWLDYVVMPKSRRELLKYYSRILKS